MMSQKRRQGHPQDQRKTLVRFNPSSCCTYEISSRNEYSVEEKTCMWYSRRDLLAIKMRKRRVTQLMTVGKFPVDQLDKICTEGLDTDLNKLRRLGHVQQSMRAVFSEQRRQRKFSKSLDSSRLAEIYFQESQPNILEAQLRGLRLELEVLQNSPEMGQGKPSTNFCCTHNRQEKLQPYKKQFLQRSDGMFRV